MGNSSNWCYAEKLHYLSYFNSRRCVHIQSRST